MVPYSVARRRCSVGDDGHEGVLDEGLEPVPEQPFERVPLLGRAGPSSAHRHGQPVPRGCGPLAQPRHGRDVPICARNPRRAQCWGFAGTGYNQSVERLDALDDLLSGVPADLQRRLATIYGSVSSLFWLAGAFDGARKPVRYQRDGARSSISSTCGWSGSGPMRSSLSACVNRSRTSEAVIGEHQGAGRRAMPRQSTPSCLAYDRRSGRAEQ